MNGILETETCTCIQQFKERIKEDKKVNYVDCENEGFIFDNRKHEHDFENLYITFSLYFHDKIYLSPRIWQWNHHHISSSPISLSSHKYSTLQTI